jgi:NitT/TauT family transport system substrate-binding protein
MLFKKRFRETIQISFPIKILVICIIWLFSITALHFHFNHPKSACKVISMGYMPVISNLSAPILDDLTKDSEQLRFRAVKFSSFAEMVESFRNGHIQAAFIIAPLSIVLKQQGEDVKVVYIGNRHESTFVVRQGLHINGLADLEGKTVAVPMKYSGHNLCLLRLLEKHNLLGRVNIVEMNPPDMAASLVSGSLDAYFVGEPFAAQTLKSKDADLLYYVEDIWENFICNLLIVKQSFIKNNPFEAKMMVHTAARCGIWAKNNPIEAAGLVSKYWHQPKELVEFALSTPENRIRFDRFTPRTDEMQYMADLMVKYGLLKQHNIKGLVDDQFSRTVNLNNITDLKSILDNQ